MHTCEKNTGDELVKRARGGDTKAFAKLYEGIYVDLYRFAFYMMRNAHDAEDVVSEAVISAFEHISNLKKASAFRSWMFTIVSNGCKKRLLSKECSQVELKETDLSAELNLEEEHDVHKALWSLTQEERMIVLMLVLGGYNSREVGEILEMNPITVRSKQKRALEKMRLLLGEEGGV
ncbi:MAG: RNA polymerase sigma factor [Hespellia sp.]|nr:RNA polymerase sigma factor [Hespellia sp.]